MIAEEEIPGSPADIPPEDLILLNNPTRAKKTVNRPGNKVMATRNTQRVANFVNSRPNPSGGFGRPQGPPRSGMNTK